jgi:putative transcriptional regulator
VFPPHESLKGHLLVASTELRDPNFARSVVLVFKHDDEGAIGLILNRRTSAPVKQVWDQVSESPCETDALLDLGGPLQGPLMAVHPHEELRELEVAPQIYFSTQKENLEHLVAIKDGSGRFFVGYAGWGRGQLEQELKGGFWRQLPATAQEVFGDQDDLWARLTKQITTAQLVSTLGIKHVPKDPSLN